MSDQLNVPCDICLYPRAVLTREGLAPHRGSLSFLAVQYDASEGEVDARQKDPLAHRKAVVPQSVGGWVHEEQAPMSELQLHRFYLPAALFSPSVSVPEDEVSCCSQRDGGDGDKVGSSSFSSSRCSLMWSCPSLYLVERRALSWCIKLGPLQRLLSHFSPVYQDKVKALSCCFCDSVPDGFQGWSPGAGWTFHPRISVGQTCISICRLLSGYIVQLSKHVDLCFFPWKRNSRKLLNSNFNIMTKKCCWCCTCRVLHLLLQLFIQLVCFLSGEE